MPEAIPKKLKQQATVLPSPLPEKYRFERKYHISAIRAEALSRQLCHVMHLDPHADAAGHYRVRSLYFDSPYNSAVYEKLDGAAVRKKFRIRLYDGNTDKITLEKKQRIHNMCSKQSQPLTVGQCKQILKGDRDWMRTAQRPLLAEFYSALSAGLAPKCIVEYDRQIFIHPNGNVRVTIDKSIRTSTYLPAFFEPNAYCVGVPLDSYAVLEVKYDHYLPDHLRLILQTTDVVQESVSKYVWARAYSEI